MDLASTLTSSHSKEENKDRLLIVLVFFYAPDTRDLCNFIVLLFLFFYSLEFVLRGSYRGGLNFEQQSNIIARYHHFIVIDISRGYGSFREADKSKFFIANKIKFCRESCLVRAYVKYSNPNPRLPVSYLIISYTCKCVNTQLYPFNNETVHRQLLRIW